MTAWIRKLFCRRLLMGTVWLWVICPVLLTPSTGVSRTAPAFLLPDLSGNKVALKDYDGYVVVLEFWATWCLSCRMSIPELVRIQNQYQEEGLVVIGISMDDLDQVKDRDLQNFVEFARINYPVLRFSESVVRAYFGNESPALPTLFLIDREGRIRQKIVGFSPETLKEELKGLLQ